MFKSSKERKEYHKEHPYAASHPYSDGRKKLKPKGAPAPYPSHSDAKRKALKKKAK